MKPIRIIVLTLVLLLVAQGAFLWAEINYSGPDDPAVVAVSKSALQRLDSGHGALRLSSGSPLDLSGAVVDIVGLISYEKAKTEEILQPKEPVGEQGSEVGLVGFEGLEVKGNSTVVQRALTDLGARKVGKRIQISLLGDVLFDFDKYNIKKEAEETLYKVVDLIKNLDTKEVVVEGYTDSKGSDEYNLDLSLKRANSVKSWLIEKGGLGDTRIIAKGYGEAKPVAPNTTPDGSDNPEGRAKNRRVEIYISALK